MSAEKQQELKAAIEAKNIGQIEIICKALANQKPKIEISEDFIILAMETFSPSTGDGESERASKKVNTSLALKYITNAGGKVSTRSLQKLIDKKDTSYLPILCSALQQTGGKISEATLISAIKNYQNSKERNEAINALLPITEKVSEDTLTVFLSRTKNDSSLDNPNMLKKILKLMRDTNQPLSIAPLQNIISSPAMLYTTALCEELVIRQLELDALGNLLINQLRKLPEDSKLTWGMIDETINTATKTNTCLPERLLLCFLEGETKTKIEAEKGHDTTLEYTNKLLNITIKSNGSFSINAIEKIIDNFPGKPPLAFINAVIDGAVKAKDNFSEVLTKIIAKKDEAYVVAFCDGLIDKKIKFKDQELITPVAMNGLSEATASKIIDAAVLTGSKLSIALLEHAIKIKSWACIDAMCVGLTKQGGETQIPERLITAAMDVPKEKDGIEACVLVMNAAIALGQNISKKVQSAVENKKNFAQTSTGSSSPPEVPTNKLSTEGKAEVEKSDEVKFLMEELRKYIKRIDTYAGNYSRGFCFFPKSRAINRHANYELAKTLLNELERSSDIPKTFSDINAKRTQLISEKGLDKLPDYVERGINSDELNTIIKTALSYNTKQENNKPRM